MPLLLCYEEIMLNIFLTTICFLFHLEPEYLCKAWLYSRVVYGFSSSSYFKVSLYWLFLRLGNYCAFLLFPSSCYCYKNYHFNSFIPLTEYYNCFPFVLGIWWNTHIGISFESAYWLFDLYFHPLHEMIVATRLTINSRSSNSSTCFQV